MADGNWRNTLELVTRSDDNERIGYLRQIDEGRWEPLNLLGIPVGDLADQDAALETVRASAMPSLIEPWWCRVPRPLAEPTVDARSVGDDVEWDRMVVAELTADRAMMRPMYAWPEESGKYLAVDLPAADVLHSEHPGE